MKAVRASQATAAQVVRLDARPLQQARMLFCNSFLASDWQQLGACWHTYHEGQMLVVTRDKLKVLFRAAMLCHKEARAACSDLQPGHTEVEPSAAPQVSTSSVAMQ